MASLGHVLFGVAVSSAHQRYALAAPPSRRERFTSVAAFSVLALSPDLDVIAFRLGIDYGAPFGHRGASHALVTAVVVGLLVAPVFAAGLRARWLPTALCCVIALASHGLFDALTDGGKGVALWWPASSERLFLPWRPIPVAPIGVRFASLRGLYCMGVELLLFSPCLLYAWWARRAR